MATMGRLSGSLHMFEKKNERLLPARRFVGRMARSALVSIGVIGVALLVGILGYHYIAALDWVDSLLNASMILTGMGPVAPMVDDASKLFASAYALFSGVVFLSAVGILLSPIFHRILHRFHLEDT